MTSQQPSRRGWPPILCEIADHIGDAAALALVVNFGGVELSIPRTMPAQHRIADVIGLDAALRCAAVFGGEKLAIPTARSLRSAKMAIIDAVTAGGPAAGTTALAYRLGVTARHIRGVKADLGRPDDEDPDQGSLF